MHLFFSVGEPSGDRHAARLLHELRTHVPTLRATGYGGPHMAQAGCDLHFELTTLAVMGLHGIAKHLPTFWKLYRAAQDFFRQERPDGVVLIDYPGFNWWIAGAAKAAGIPVFYYCPPQLWAWGRWRLGKMKRLVDHVLCPLPFEFQWFQQRGLNAVYVGHPFFDEVVEHELRLDFLEEFPVTDVPLIALLPGSRRQEVQHNLPCFLHAAELLHARFPRARFLVACYNEKLAELARPLIAASGVPAEISIGRTPEIMQVADACLAVSGSVSLELLAHAVPSLIVYRLSPFYEALRPLLHIRSITLVNLLARDDIYGRYRPEDNQSSRTPFPEYVTTADPAPQLAAQLTDWLTHSARYEEKVDQLHSLRERFARPGAARRVASYLLRTLRASST